MVAEVLSPSTALKDYNEKFNIYQQFSDNKYWIVDPTNKMCHVHSLKEGHFSQRITYGEQDMLQSFLFVDLFIDLKTGFFHFIFESAARKNETKISN